MTQIRHKDPHFTGFDGDGDNYFFYIRGCEHTYWSLHDLDGSDVASLLDIVTAFYTKGVETAREMIEGKSYVPPEQRPAVRFRLVSETLRNDETDEPLGWSNEMGWIDLSSATLFTEEEALAAQLIGESFRVEEVFP